jgi:hypothetical protein
MRVQTIVLVLLVSLSMTNLSYAEKKKKDDAKTLSGISIIGNKDAPKSLYIVPWRSSELGFESDLNSSLLNEGMHPVDKDVFERELNFYEISTVK